VARGVGGGDAWLNRQSAWVACGGRRWCGMTVGDAWRSVTLGCRGTMRNVKYVEGHKKVALILC
jgi:hypothetical protein